MFASIGKLILNKTIPEEKQEEFSLRINNSRVYRQLLTRGTLGFGESYMNGDWDCNDLAGFIAYIRQERGMSFTHLTPPSMWLAIKSKLINMQSPRRASMVGKRHYDIGNDIYKTMLDPRMVYTCGYWAHAKDLAQAQEHKLRLICEKLHLKPGQKVLDIGCGWGSFAKFAAKEYGVEVVGITVSEEQVDLGRKLCKGLPVEIKFLDYRALPKEYPAGYFDAVVSIGMFEHVGPKNYEKYFDDARAVLKPGGLFLLHTIVGETERPEPWLHRYIFPNGVLPSLQRIYNAVHTRFTVEDAHNFGADYDKTLCAWYQNFDRSWPELKEKYGDRFYRMWRYYLLTCAGMFRARRIHLFQFVLSPTGVSGGYSSVR